MDVPIHLLGATDFGPIWKDRIHREPDILGHSHPGKQAIILEHYSAIGARALDDLPPKGHETGIRLQQAGDQVQQG